LKDALVVSLFSMIPRRWASSFIGSAMRTVFSRPLLRWFVWQYGLDLTEAERADTKDYRSLADLFSRALKPGARPLDASPDVLVSPVDGTVALCATAQGGLAEVAPGRRIDLKELVGEEVPDELDVLVCYLSPKDYHRVHMPCDAQTSDHRHIPGDRWPVFPSAVRRLKGLFSRNERVVTTLQTDKETLTLVLVAAFGVGHITWPDGGIAAQGAPVFSGPLSKGDWLGTFELGSTVVLLCDRGSYAWDVKTGDDLRVGQRIGAHRGSI
jgi:phosphatidylserine decarboxylase